MWFASHYSILVSPLKTQIRQNLIAQRSQLTNTEQSEFSELIVQNIISSEIFQASNTIAIYIAINGEVDLTKLLKLPKSYLLPVVHEENSMHFTQYKLGDELKMNRYKILEPTYPKHYPSEKIDLCLLPLVGFNRNGGRIGMGAGFYDRYFAINHMLSRPTVLAGIAYDFQENDSIENDYWDIPLDFIFTNKEVITTNESR